MAAEAEDVQQEQQQIALSTTAEYPSYPISKTEAWGVTSLKAPHYEPTSRSSVDVAAVIDKSGSMAGTKLQLVKKTLLFVVDQLKDCDRLALVTYDTNVYTDFPLTRMTPANKERIKTLVQSIKDGSCTNLCGGLMAGMQQIVDCTEEKAQVQSVLLLTDGLANEGIKSKDGILKEMNKLQSKTDKSKKFDGTVYTFGFGSDHDSSMLEAISTQGGGVYYYIDSNEKIPESFADCLGGLLSVVGQNLSIKLEAVGGATLTGVHANRDVKWSKPNLCCEISLGDIQSEEERDIVLQLELAAVDAPCSDTVLRASLSYFNVITSMLDTITQELSVQRRDGELTKGTPNAKVDLQRNRINATKAMKEAEPLADQGKLAEAKALIQKAISSIESSATAEDEFNKMLLEDLKRCLESMKSREEYRGHGKLYMKSKMQTHAVQRSNYVDDHSYYQSSAKKAMKRKI